MSGAELSSAELSSAESAAPKRQRRNGPPPVYVAYTPSAFQSYAK